MSTANQFGIPARSPDKPPLLSFAQQRLWFLDQLEPALAAYNMPRAFKLTGELDVGALKQSLDEIVRRHEILRTTFHIEKDTPVQKVAPSLDVPLSVVDHSDSSQIEQAQLVQTILETETAKPFSLTQGPLIRTTLLKQQDNEHVLFFMTHHIVFDGWSFGVFFRELSALYGAYRSGTESLLEKPTIQFADYAVWERERQSEASIEPQVSYWRQHLAGPLPMLQLPSYRPRPTVQTFVGADRQRVLPQGLLPSLRSLQRSERVTMFMLLLAAFKVVLLRYTGQHDLIVGSPNTTRNRPELEDLIGFFVNNLVLRTDLSGDPSFRDVVRRLRETCLDAYRHQEVPFDSLVEEIAPERDLSRTPFFQVMFDVQGPQPVLELAELEVEPLPLERGSSHFDLTLTMHVGDDMLEASLNYNTDLFGDVEMDRMLGHLEMVLEQVGRDPEQSISKLEMLSEEERQEILVDWNATQTAYPEDHCVHELFEAQVLRTPDAVAVAFKEESLSYRELNRRSNALAHRLLGLGVGPEVLVGICMERSDKIVVALLAVLKAGGAYVPIDPTYPRQRIEFMIEDSGASVVLTQGRLVDTLSQHGATLFDVDGASIQNGSTEDPVTEVTPENLAYVIYTSGSTGEPKGVMVRHRNVSNFIAGMDEHLGGDAGVWLAVTSISFDISVLELLWTLSRGFKVVIQPGDALTDSLPSHSPRVDKNMAFSLFYFAADEDEGGEDKYRLLMEGAKLADALGFEAIWTPERHFHAFGGLYPSPSVAGAALAMVTRNLKIRAGSVVLPLHDPVRVAEEWSLVDNLSKGRVGVSFASGWHDRDFVLAPDSYEERWELMFRGIETVQGLWRGDSIVRKSGRGADIDVAIRPEPVQKMLPVWVTAAGSPGTIERAGTLGANLLTHLLGQTVEMLSEKIAIYREARAKAGHDGSGTVTLMLHTFVGPDTELVREKVRGPFTRYLRSAVDLIGKLAEGRGQNIRDANFTEKDMEALLEFAFNRYFDTSALFGTPEECAQKVERLKEVGVDEVACLIDFGVDAEAVLSSLELLAEVMEATNARPEAAVGAYTIAEQIRRHGVTHLQCTPSMARMLVASHDERRELGNLEKIMVGGEAFPASLAVELADVTSAEILNMYGPTETTIWSSIHRLTGTEDRTVPIGFPIANTQLYVLDGSRRPVPVGVTGELYIGGEGVVRGYFNRPELTDERFVPNGFAKSSSLNSRLYRTGDLVRRLPDGNIEFLGRTDSQVKIRGHRIELGEIETVLETHRDVRQAVAVMREDRPGDQRLVAYTVLEPGRRSTTTVLREHLRAELPDHMLPQHFVELDEVPKTPNGKIDRRALPPPFDALMTSEEDYVEPQTEAEKHLAAIWQELLGVDRVGRGDRFFDIGGHSLLAAQVVGLIRERLGAEVSLRSLVLDTLAQIAEECQQSTPSSDSQNGLWSKLRARIRGGVGDIVRFTDTAS